jgi:hypothetical protein
MINNFVQLPKIYDNFLDEQFLEYINFIIEKKLYWTIHRSTSAYDNSFFNSITDDRQDFDFIAKKCFQKLESDLNFNKKGIILERHYVNLYPYNVGGDWHQDERYPNTLSFIFMPSDWKPEYDGALLFKDSMAQKEHNLKIEYKKNRLIAFYGEKIHKGELHTNPNNRYTFTIKSHVDMVSSDVINS